MQKIQQKQKGDLVYLANQVSLKVLNCLRQFRSQLCIKDRAVQSKTLTCPIQQPVIKIKKDDNQLKNKENKKTNETL